MIPSIVKIIHCSNFTYSTSMTECLPWVMKMPFNNHDEIFYLQQILIYNSLQWVCLYISSHLRHLWTELFMLTKNPYIADYWSILIISYHFLCRSASFTGHPFIWNMRKLRSRVLFTSIFMFISSYRSERLIF